jgi:hypothetical protein
MAEQYPYLGAFIVIALIAVFLFLPSIIALILEKIFRRR